jgi:hypothetical protein
VLPRLHLAQLSVACRAMRCASCQHSGGLIVRHKGTMFEISIGHSALRGLQWLYAPHFCTLLYLRSSPNRSDLMVLLLPGFDNDSRERESTPSTGAIGGILETATSISKQAGGPTPKP